MRIVMEDPPENVPADVRRLLVCLQSGINAGGVIDAACRQFDGAERPQDEQTQFLLGLSIGLAASLAFVMGRAAIPTLRQATELTEIIGKALKDAPEGEEASTIAACFGTALRCAICDITGEGLEDALPDEAVPSTGLH